MASFAADFIARSVDELSFCRESQTGPAMLKKLFKPFRLPLQPKKPEQPTVLDAHEHRLSCADFNRNAANVAVRLQQAGFEAYLVGGCVRDSLIGVPPKDFDVATSATPEQVRHEFRNSRIIGRRFKLVHVHFGRELIEVATFRSNHEQDDEVANNDQSAHDASGRILRDNVYGTMEDDAQRRDFTMNALYFDVNNDKVHDYSTGFADIQRRLIRLIGDPEQRYLEDPVRMLRAIRFAAKLDFAIEDSTAEPIRRLATCCATFLRHVYTKKCSSSSSVVMPCAPMSYCANTIYLLNCFQVRPKRLKEAQPMLIFCCAMPLRARTRAYKQAALLHRHFYLPHCCGRRLRYARFTCKKMACPPCLPPKKQRIRFC